MRIKQLLTFSITSVLLCTSCIKDEALNTEADIEKCILPENILTDAVIKYDAPYDQTLNAYPLRIEVKNGVSLTSLAPTFELTPGASISPASGTPQDFTRPVRYTVTSEDGQWQRTYSIIVRHPNLESIPTSFFFEKVRKQDKYQVLYEESDGYSTLTWASGNQGFAFAQGNAAADQYPTTLSNKGYEGNCAQLITRSTGGLGALVNMPIAAGNLFIGDFNMANALTDPLAATTFGHTFYYKPTKLTGYYKYKAGEKFYENGAYTDKKKDIFNIYALFFKKTPDVQKLNGHIVANNYEHPNMVALAVIDNAKETDEWIKFELPFDYKYGKEVDPDQLSNGEYSLGIIFSSSKEGDMFKGAPGSTLLIDNVVIEYETIEKLQ